MHQKGAIALAVPILLIIAALIALYILFLQKVIPSSLSKKTQKSSQEPTVTLKTSYSNPFDKNAQFINPFSEYTNPFDRLKK